jgi:hypothetical protein
VHPVNGARASQRANTLGRGPIRGIVLLNMVRQAEAKDVGDGIWHLVERVHDGTKF